VRGHSFIPPDRVFGKIEKRVKKSVTIKTPAGYHHIFKHFGRVKVLKKHWTLYNFREWAKQFLTEKLGDIKIRNSRVWTLRRNKREIGISYLYAGTPEWYNILKPDAKFQGIQPPPLKMQTHVTKLKKADVEFLLKSVSLNPSEEEFFKEALKEVAKKKFRMNWSSTSQNQYCQENRRCAKNLKVHRQKLRLLLVRNGS